MTTGSLTRLLEEGEDVRGVASPQDLPGAFMLLFNAGAFDEVELLFDRQAVRVTADGSLLHGPQRIRPTRELHASGARLSLRLAGCFVSDGVALLLTACTVEVVGGPAVSATAVDVARRDPDTGRWAYLIDNPVGVGLPTS